MTEIIARAEFELEADVAPQIVSNESRSILFRLSTADGEITAGAALGIDGEPLSAGETRVVKLLFWADEVDELVVLGVEFIAWYSRDIGRGRILARV